MKNKSFFLWLYFFALMISPAFSFNSSASTIPELLKNADPQAICKNLETQIPELMEKARIPGLQIALIREGRIIWHRSFGEKSSETGEPVSDDTLFEAASLTKPFFAYAVMKLVDEGVIELDKPLIEYLPKETVEKELGHSLDAEGFKKEWFVKITARQVLSHSSGMPHGESGKTYPLFFEPGTKFKYSAAGYYFLQKAVELRKGQQLETIMKQYVLDPLGMKRSSMIWRGEYEKTMANGHSYFGKPESFRKRTTAHSAASLYTTAEEYGRFVCAILNGEGIRSETLKRMLTPLVEVDKKMGLFWSLGFGIQEDPNGPAFWQWGDYGIFRNYVIAYPKEKIAVVYLANSFYGLGICPDLVSMSIGGQALGNTQLGYKHYDHPLYHFSWKAKEEGPKAVRELYPLMKVQLPDDFTQKTINDIGSIFRDEKMFDEAIALFELNVKDNPESSQAISLLARAYLEKGDKEQAKLLYNQASEAKEKESFDPATVNWALDYIKALENPLSLEVSYLKTLTGGYETRHLIIKEEKLYYFRENTDSKDYKQLIPITSDTFVIEGLIFFRLKIEFDGQGLPVKLIGLYEWGDQDQTVRDK